MPIPHHILKEPVVDRAVDLLLFDAAEAGASEILLEPSAQDARVRMRRDGLLHDLFRQAKPAHAGFIGRLKRLAHMREAAPLALQERELRRVAMGATVEGFLSVAPVPEGEKAVLRVRTLRPDFSALGFSEAQRDGLVKRISHGRGLLLLAGPRRSGVTTTLHALLEAADPLRRHVVSIEDRLESDTIGIDQRAVDPVAGRTWSAALRAAVADGAAVIGLGALRDEETAAVALSAAAHRLVIAVIEAPDVQGALLGLLDLRIEPRAAAQALSGVLVQRLARRACSSCRRREMFSRSEARAARWPSALTKNAFGKSQAVEVTRAAKCERCRFTGHRGQIGIFELNELAPGGRRGVALREDGLRKVLAGTIAPEELLRL